jgi:hypothetical protein
MNTRALAALASVAFFAGGGGAAPAQTASPASAPPMVMTMAPMPAPSGPAAMRTMPQPAGALALDARALRGSRTTVGYRVTAQALVKDACQAARFTQFMGNIFPPQFNLVQYRRPGTMGMLCIQRLTWVFAQPLNVTSAAPPRWVTVRTQKGFTRVPILPGPAY